MTQLYKLSEDKKQEYAAVFLLENMVNKPATFPVYLERDDAVLEPILEWLLLKDLVEIKDNERYVPTPRGRSLVERFLARYTEYLNVFDVFCAVDLEAGEFAFESYFDYNDPVAWKSFLNQDNWDDLRVAVAGFKKLDPIEIVFMSFVTENRFGQDSDGWQFDLLLGTVWDEILEICNTAIQWEDLGFEDDEGEIPAESVIEDIIKQGSELMIQLHEREAKLFRPIDHYGNGSSEDPREEDNDEDEFVVERVVIDEHPMDYYYPYLDPFFVSPILIGALILF